MRGTFNLKGDEASRFLLFAKGIAISLIIVHHFARSAWLERTLQPPTSLQWQFLPTATDLSLILASFRDGHWSEAFLRIAAQYAYVGVHLFVLASGLGLSLGTPDGVGFRAFMQRRLMKLVPPFWLAVFIFLAARHFSGQDFSASQIAKRLFLLTTFEEGNFFIIDSPLWCLAIFFQLYILFLPMRALIQRQGAIVLLPLALCALVARWLTGLPSVVDWNQHFGDTFALNWLAVFGIGIWIGTKIRQNGSANVDKAMVLTAIPIFLVLIISSNIWPVIYPFHDTAIGWLMGSAAFLSWRAVAGTGAASLTAVIGSVSYPLYLYHRPIVAEVVHLWFRKVSSTTLPPPIVGFMLLAVLTLSLSLVKAAFRRWPKASALILGT